LLEGVVVSVPEDLEEQLLSVLSRVVGLAGDADLVFVGRSPESLFDLASGLLADTSWSPRVELLPLSLPPGEHLRPADERTLQAYLATASLDAPRIASHTRLVAFVDLVSSGETLAQLVAAIRDSCHAPVDWRSVVSKLRVVGITCGGKLWADRIRAHRLLPPRCLATVSISFPLWHYLADDQPKVSRSFGPWVWRDESVGKPPRDPQALQALRLAVYLFELGRRREVRRQFAAELANQPAFRSAWLRSLALELKR
jgi:hypothetical protein